jgi:hypothetical protein
MPIGDLKLARQPSDARAFQTLGADEVHAPDINDVLLETRAAKVLVAPTQPVGAGVCLHATFGSREAE